MVQSSSWEATWFAASQEILRISQNPKIHYRIHKRPPTVCNLGQPNPVHIPTFHLLDIHTNIIYPSTPRSLQLSPSLRFLHQNPIHPLSSPISATCPAHLIILDFITRTILGEKTYITHNINDNYIWPVCFTHSTWPCCRQNLSERHTYWTIFSIAKSELKTAYAHHTLKTLLQKP